ncbi:hypothetical protein BT93_D1409 [Corymbia citriodora subsp. variegata]|nr:hypothetical protein BT93_D1409 [Corymbia citriodora subsp. variegata]
MVNLRTQELSATANLETQALKAIKDQDFKLAVKLFTQAISISPSDAELFAGRSYANLKLCMFTECLDDAERAIDLDPSMPMAYFCKGKACYELKDYQTAKTALISGSCCVLGNAKFIDWIKQCDEHIAGASYQRPSNPSSKRKRGDFGKVEAQEMEENREKLGADACHMKITGSGSQTPLKPSSKRQRENREKLGADAFHEDRDTLTESSATTDLETQALKAIMFLDFKQAVTLFTQAISISPNSAELFVGRSRANFKLCMFTERAIDLDSSMPKAYFRKGKACYQLKDYQTAKAAFESGSFRVPGNERFINLINRCDKRIAGTGCQRPTNPSPEQQRIDCDEVEAKKLEENREKLGADALEENREKSCSDESLPVRRRRHQKKWNS